MESHEYAVIAGADWTRYRPRIVLVEDNGATSWEPLLLAADYQFAVCDGINRYYVRAEEPALLEPLRRRPAVIALDDYIPFRYHHILERASAESETQTRAITQAQNEIDRARNELTQMANHLADVEQALAEARTQLVGTSPRTLRFARAIHTAARRHPRLASVGRRLLAG